MENKDTLIVSVDDFSMKFLIDKNFYAMPRKINPKTKYLAFYQKMPISAITHYGIIDVAKEGNLKDVGLLIG